jgi:signal transduction histidine kinase
MLNSLKLKITTAALLIICIIMFVSAWRNIEAIEQKLLDGQKEKAVLISERIAHGIMVLMLKNMWKDMQVMMEGMVKDSKELKEIRIFLPEKGTIVASSKPEEVGTRIYREGLQLFKEKGGREAFVIEKNNQHYASKLTPLENHAICHRCHGSTEKILGVMDVEISLAGVQQSIRDLKKEHLLDTAIAFFLMGGGFLLVIGLLIDSPIKKMIKTIRRIESGDLSARMKEGKADEFGLVAKSFNRMLGSLESANNEIKRCHNEQMQRAAKLASLGEIISGIAHEIKNPLAGISCAVQVFQSEVSDDDNRKAITKEILDQINRLDRTVKGLLNFARPKPPRFAPARVMDVLDKAMFFIYPEAKKHNVVARTESEDDIPDIMMDADQIEQVFLNLMINAVQAMPSGGELKVSVSLLNKDEFDSDSSVQSNIEKIVSVEFQDTGDGIEQENVRTIFDPFFTKKAKGTGLGLSISRRIVQEHGGDISVISEVGKGSTFTVYLPVFSKISDSSSKEYHEAGRLTDIAGNL